LLPLGLKTEYLSEFNQQVEGLEPLVSLLLQLASESIVSEFHGIHVLVLVNPKGEAIWKVFRAVWPLIDVLDKDVFNFLLSVS
jgi:hypothetical protein